MKKFEKFLSKMKDSQEFASDDRLSRLIGKFDDELSMDELDHIAAAAKPDFFYRKSEQED